MFRRGTPTNFVIKFLMLYLAYLDGDPESRVAIEACGGHGQIFIVGEVTSTSPISHDNITKIVHDLAGNDLKVMINIVEQSPEIARGVDDGGAETRES